MTPSCSNNESIQCKKKQLQHWLVLRARHQRATRKLQWPHPVHLFLRLLCRLKRQLPQSTVLVCGGPEKKEAEAIDYRQMAKLPTTKSLILDNIPEPLCNGLVKMRMRKVLTISFTSASIIGRPIPDFENLEFKIASGLRKILTGNFKKQVTTAEAKLNQRRDHFLADRFLG